MESNLFKKWMKLLQLFLDLTGWKGIGLKNLRRNGSKHFKLYICNEETISGRVQQHSKWQEQRQQQ